MVRKAIKSLGYPAKRKGYWLGAVWYLRNTNRDWKEQSPCITNDELAAAGEAQPRTVLRKRTSMDDHTIKEYLADL